MPKVRMLIPPEQKAIEDELYARYGGMMDKRSVGIEIGLRGYHAISDWLSDVPGTMINGRKRYRVAVIAKKIYDSMEEVE